MLSAKTAVLCKLVDFCLKGSISLSRTFCTFGMFFDRSSCRIVSGSKSPSRFFSWIDVFRVPFGNVKFYIVFFFRISYAVLCAVVELTCKKYLLFVIFFIQKSEVAFEIISIVVLHDVIHNVYNRYR